MFAYMYLQDSLGILHPYTTAYVSATMSTLHSMIQMPFYLTVCLLNPLPIGQSSACVPFVGITVLMRLWLFGWDSSHPLTA